MELIDYIIRFLNYDSNAEYLFLMVVMLISIAFMLYDLYKISRQTRGLIEKVLEYKNNKLQITPNSYVFMNEEKEIFFFLNGECVEKLYYGLFNSFTFDTAWHKAIVKEVFKVDKQMKKNLKQIRAKQKKEFKHDIV